MRGVRIGCALAAFAFSCLPALALGHEPLIAFVARFYYPAGDHRTSYHQVYLCDLHGAHRRQLTFGKSERSDVRWIGRRRLAWLETVAVTNEDDEGLHAARSASRRLIEYDLATGHGRIIATGFIYANNDWHQTVQYPRGQTVYVKTNAPTDYDPPSSAPNVLKTFDVADDHLKATSHAPLPLYTQNEGDEPSPWKAARLDVTVVDDGRTKEALIKCRDGGEMGGDATSISYRGTTSTVAIPNIDLVWPSRRKAGICWVRCGAFASSGGSDLWVSEVDLKTGKAQMIANDVLDLDFQADSSYWASSSNNKELADLGAHRVWARDLWIGETETGKQWRITSGAVQGTCARVQP